jgi:hypothetical protein
MNNKIQGYRFARIEAQKITKARLEARFKDGIGSVEDLETEIELLLTLEATPWRKSELERAGSRNGTRHAALEFYREHRQRLPSAAES